MNAGHKFIYHNIYSNDQMDYSDWIFFQSVKRKSDSETGGSLGAGSMMNPCKKSKLNPKDAKLRPQTKIFFESLN